MPPIRRVLFSIVFVLFTLFSYKTIFVKITETDGFNIQAKYSSKILDIIETAISSRLSNISSLTKDWSNWDDTVTFLQDFNKQYIEDNLSDESLTNIDINLAIYYSTDGRIAYVKSVKNTAVPDEMSDPANPKSLIPLIKTGVTNNEGFNGIIHTTNGDFIYAAEPVLGNSGEGPVKGFLLMGRKFTTSDNDALRKTLGLDFEINDFTNLKEDLEKGLIKNGVVIKQTGNNIESYKLVKDQFGIPAMYIKYTNPLEVPKDLSRTTTILYGIATLGTLMVAMFFGIKK